MTKEFFTLQIADVSAFARTLGQALSARHASKPEPPGQVELLNLIARTQGQRNWSALRLALRQRPVSQPVLQPVQPAVDEAAPAPAAPLSDNARKALAQFDQRGRLMRWPVKYSVQKLVMWVLWTRFDAKRSYTEAEVNAILKAANLFFDHATLRRQRSRLLAQGQPQRRPVALALGAGNQVQQLHLARRLGLAGVARAQGLAQRARKGRHIGDLQSKQFLAHGASSAPGTCTFCA